MDKQIWRWMSADERDESHDRQQVEYWLSRPIEERLARAQDYRRAVYGSIASVDLHTWRWVSQAELDRE
jgi:hypothetical protein